MGWMKFNDAVPHERSENATDKYGDCDGKQDWNSWGFMGKTGNYENLFWSYLRDW